MLEPQITYITILGPKNYISNQPWIIEIAVAEMQFHELLEPQIEKSIKVNSIITQYVIHMYCIAVFIYLSVAHKARTAHAGYH